MSRYSVKWTQPSDEKFEREFLVIKCTNDGIDVIHRESYQSRAERTVDMIVEALQRLNLGERTIEIPVYTGDAPWRSPEYNGMKVLAYSTCNAQECQNVVPIPDFIFRGWPEAGIGDYRRTIEECIRIGDLEPEFHDVFWIGSPLTNPIRQQAVDRFSDVSGFSIVPMNWAGPVRANNIQASVYVSIPDHARHSVLCDLPAGGYSGRFKLLLWTGRPVIVLRTSYAEYFFSGLRSNYNCIVVDNLEELEAAGRRLLSDRDLAAYIGRNGRRLALEWLVYEKAISYLADTIRKNYLQDVQSKGEINLVAGVDAGRSRH